MSASWHYAKDGRPFGPFTTEQMRQLAASGLLSASDLVRGTADGAWVVAGSVAELTGPPPNPNPPVGGPAGAPAPHSPVTPSSGVGAAIAQSRPTAVPAKRSWVTAAVTWVALLPVGMYGLSDQLVNLGGVLHRPALLTGAVVAVVTWSALGLWAAATGVLPTVSGMLRRWPVLNRVGGLAVVTAGWLLAAGLNREANRAGGGNTVAAGYERYDLGGGRQILHPPGQRAAAERLGGVLRKAGFFDGPGSVGVALDRRAGGWVVKIATPEAARGDPAVLAVYRNGLGIVVAARAFPGETVEYQLCDPALSPHAVIPIPPTGVAEVQGEDAVYYLGPIRAEATRLAAFLKHRLGAPAGRAFVLSRREALWHVVPLGLDADALAPAGADALSADATAMSWDVFAGGPVEVDVYDREFRPKRTFRSAPPRTDVELLLEGQRRWKEKNAILDWNVYRTPPVTPKENPP